MVGVLTVGVEVGDMDVLWRGEGRGGEGREGEGREGEGGNNRALPWPNTWTMWGSWPSTTQLLGLLFVVCWLVGWLFGWLLVVGCWLLVVGCWLLVVGCWLLVVDCWLLVVGCWLLVVGLSFVGEMF